MKRCLEQLTIQLQVSNTEERAKNMLYKILLVVSVMGLSFWVASIPTVLVPILAPIYHGTHTEDDDYIIIEAVARQALRKFLSGIFITSWWSVETALLACEKQEFIGQLLLNPSMPKGLYITLLVIFSLFGIAKYYEGVSAFMAGFKHSNN